MKRTALVKHLERHGCRLVREGARHSLYGNPDTGSTVAVPRPESSATSSALRDPVRSVVVV